MIAVIPAAGLGTRMASVTQGRPKELLVVAGKPVLQWVIEECFDAGAETVRIVNSPRKPEIDAFVASLDNSAVFIVSQPEPLGLADAVLRALEPGLAALVPMPDYLFPTDSPSRRLGEAVASEYYGAVAVHEVPLERVSQYGVVGFDEAGRVDRVVEKPPIAEAPSRWAVAGRFALSERAVQDFLNEPGRFANLAELFETGRRRGEPIFASRISTPAFDCGDPEGYRAAVATLGT